MKGIAAAVLGLTFVAIGSGNLEAATFVLCNRASAGEVAVRYVYLARDNRWIIVGPFHLGQSRCQDIRHFGSHVYFYADNKRGVVWTGPHSFCAPDGHVADAVRSGSCARTWNFRIVYTGRESYNEHNLSD